MGDDLPVHIALADGVAVDDVFRIVGTYDLFPTITPGERAVFIGNLDFLSGMVGITVGHDIWLRVAAGTPGPEVFAAVPQLGIGAESRRDSRAIITQARDRYERVAVFGTLTQGFLTAVAMAAITLLIYCRASMQERIWWLSVLHAVGTTRRQLVRTLVVEQAVVLAFGTTLAVALGTLTSRLFVPYMRIAPQAAGALQAAGAVGGDGAAPSPDPHDSDYRDPRARRHFHRRDGHPADRPDPPHAGTLTVLGAQSLQLRDV